MSDNEKPLRLDELTTHPFPPAEGIPIFLGEGDNKIQIGTARLEEWKSPGFIKILGDIDVFPGERLTFSRISVWKDVIEYSRARYHEE